MNTQQQSLPRILVGCPTSFYQEYCLPEYVRAVKNLTYPLYDILLVDNSEDDSYFKKIQSFGLPVIKGPWFQSAKERIVASRNLLREKAVQQYDYFLSLEQDVIPPKDVIERLLAHKKEVLSGMYYTVKDKGLRPLLIVKNPVTGALSYLDSQKILEYNTLFEITLCGLGCVLISCKILTQLSFRHVLGNKSFDDFWFCKDVLEKGFRLYADPSVLCNHLFLKRPWKWEDLEK